MKKYLGLLLAMCCIHSTYSQPSNGSMNITPDEYENKKSLSIGFTYQNLAISNLNKQLDQNGYGPAGTGITCVSVQSSVRYKNGLGFFYGADFGLDAENKDVPKYKKAQYYRIEAGATYRAFELQHLACFAHVGFGYGVYTLRLYDRAADTSFNNYLAGSADGKRMQTDMFGMSVGLQSRIYLGKSPYLGLGGGCIIPFNKTTWRHDGGELQESPAVPLATWYAQVKLGIEFRRKITRLKNEHYAESKEKAVKIPDNLLQL